ncbi:MAG: permease prefix domain 1-containing protein [Planctomycetota bacterium]|jgi:hypothetical protein
MSRVLKKYLDRIMIYAKRNEKDAERIRVELKDHLLEKVADLEAAGLSREQAICRAIEECGHAAIVGYGLRKRFWWLGLYIRVAIVLFMLDYFLLIGRFYWFGFGSFSTWVYAVINFPFSVLHLWLEKKPNPWWYGIFGHRFEYIFNDEIGILLAGKILILLQAVLITVLLLQIRKRWNKKHNHSVAVD